MPSSFRTSRRPRFGSMFYVANVMEIFERLAWYGFFTVSSLYMTTAPQRGGLGFSNSQRGVLQGIIPFFVYLLPVFTGALADRVGYRRMFICAYVILIPAYFLLGEMRGFWPFFMVYMLVALGAAMFKPLVVGTVSRVTDDSNRGIGFGIFYLMVNIGGFLGPILAGTLRVLPARCAPSVGTGCSRCHPQPSRSILCWYSFSSASLPPKSRRAAGGCAQLSPMRSGCWGMADSH